jgi:succinyl-CoA synthetase beta subunit
MYEYEVKQILSKAGIQVPHGIVADTPQKVKQAVSELGGRAVLKLQFPDTDNNKPVNIAYASSAEEGMHIAEAMLCNPDYISDKILVEEKLEIQQEIYIGIMKKDNITTLFASAIAGIEIGKFEYSSRIYTFIVDSNYKSANLENFLEKIGFTGVMLKKLHKIAEILYQIFINSGASVLEINRLGVIPYDKRKLVAIDVKMY